MVQAKRSVRGHTGRTSRGNTRDLKVERVGAVTVYKRGVTYYIYYRESGRSVQRAASRRRQPGHREGHGIACLCGP